MFESIALGLVNALHRLEAMTVIGVFTTLLVMLFVVALGMIARGRAGAFSRGAPTLLTMLGILGTFLGIAIGLLQFDVTRVEYSIPTLLDGLKLAFITSILGILFGASLRLVLSLSADASDAARGTLGAGDNATPARATDLAEAQLALTAQLDERLARLERQLDDRLNRQHQELLAALSDFAGQLSELGSRQLIQALEAVIRDFNTNLGAQFGENFRQLDSAVQKLLRWQQDYRQHLEALGGQLDRATAGVAKSEATLEALTQQALRISQHVTDQEAAMASLKRETMELESLLSAIAELRDKAKDAFPAMDRRLTAMLESIENAVLAAQQAEHRLRQPARASAQTAREVTR